MKKLIFAILGLITCITISAQSASFKSELILSNGQSTELIEPVRISHEKNSSKYTLSFTFRGTLTVINVNYKQYLKNSYCYTDGTKDDFVIVQSYSKLSDLINKELSPYANETRLIRIYTSRMEIALYLNEKL